ncbi:hypothetical protein EDB82DRAFT_499777, partial [Fusarium venenatum]
QRAGEKTDLDIALEAYHNELEAVAIQAFDHTMALSIARAVRSDAPIIAEAQEAEEQVERDHQFAMSLSGDGQVPQHTSESLGKVLDDDLMEYLAALNGRTVLAPNGTRDIWYRGLMILSTATRATTTSTTKNDIGVWS